MPLGVCYDESSNARLCAILPGLWYPGDEGINASCPSTAGGVEEPALEHGTMLPVGRAGWDTPPPGGEQLPIAAVWFRVSTAKREGRELVAQFSFSSPMFSGWV